MPEHVHEWGVDAEFGGCIVAYCTVDGCDEKRDGKWIHARLNATERLSAEDARAILREDLTDYMCMLHLEYEIESTHERSKPLKAYADTLESDA